MLNIKLLFINALEPYSKLYIHSIAQLSVALIFVNIVLTA